MLKFAYYLFYLIFFSSFELANDYDEHNYYKAEDDLESPIRHQLEALNITDRVDHVCHSNLIDDYDHQLADIAACSHWADRHRGKF